MGGGNIGKWFCPVWPTVRIFFGRIILLYMKIHFFLYFLHFLPTNSLREDILCSLKDGILHENSFFYIFKKNLTPFREQIICSLRDRFQSENSFFSFFFS